MDFNHKSRARLNSDLASSAFWGISISLSEDIWLEIFKGIPVKTLCRFQCVCKKWKSIISSTFFIPFHHSFSSLTTPPNNKPYLRLNAGDIDQKSYSLHNNNNNNNNTQPQHLHFPFRFVGNLAGRHPNQAYHLNLYKRFALTRCLIKHSSLHFTCVDVINGVVCISYSINSGFDSTILWNPSIHKYLPLPQAKFHFDTEDESLHDYHARFVCYAIGFGYNKSKADFMVSRIWIPKFDITDNRFWPYPAAPLCEVYSCREGKWRSVAFTQYNPEFSSCRFGERWSFRTSCYVNGKIHWVVRGHVDGERRYFLVILDCESEELTTAELPAEVLSEAVPGDSITAMVLEYASMLSVVLNFRFPIGKKSAVELWVMTEYGVADTWQRIYRFKEEDICRYNPSVEIVAPYGPDTWRQFYRRNFWGYEILSGHVFEESMFMMDDSDARSYTKEESRGQE